MSTDDLKRVREHIEAIILGRSSLTPIEIKGADGELRSALAGLQVLSKQLKERTAALSARESWFKGVVSAARIAIWECDTTAVRGMLDLPGTLDKLDSEAELVRVLADEAPGELRLVEGADDGVVQRAVRNARVHRHRLGRVQRSAAVR